MGNPTLTDIVQKGHKWWVLKEDTSEAAQVDISLWRNQDQNENHGTHEIEILQTIVATAECMRASAASDSKVVSLSDLVAKAARRNPAKISPWFPSTMCKFFRSSSHRAICTSSRNSWTSIHGWCTRGNSWCRACSLGSS